MNYADLDALHAAIGESHVSAQSIAQRVARELRGGEHEVSCRAPLASPAGSTSARASGCMSRDSTT